MNASAISPVAVAGLDRPLLGFEGLGAEAAAQLLQDMASADALVFSARRLTAEPVAMLFAAPEGTDRVLAAPGLPELVRASSPTGARVASAWRWLRARL